MKEKVLTFILIADFLAVLYQGRNIFQQPDRFLIFVLFVVIFFSTPYFIFLSLRKIQNSVIHYLNTNFPDYSKKQHIEELKKIKFLLWDPKDYFQKTFFELPDLPKSDFICKAMKKTVILRLLSGLSIMVSACLFVFIVIFLQQSWDNAYIFSAVLVGGGLPFLAAFIGYVIRLKRYGASLK